MKTTASQFLKHQFASRQRKNPHYSLRAFARDLQMHPGTLSAVMAGKRELPQSSLAGIARSLNLSPRKVLQLSNEKWLKASALSTDSFLIEDKDNIHFEVLSEWEHFAVLSLTNTKDFVSTPRFVADRLGISLIRAEVVIQNLFKCDLLRTIDGRWEPTFVSVNTSEGITSSALRKAHLEELQMAMTKLSDIPLEWRNYTSVTLATARQRIPQMKALIGRFREELIALAEGDADDNEEVYQLCIQLFPLSQIEKETGDAILQ